MPSHLPISVCFVSGAEAHRIGQALESVAAWAQEIIVVLNEEVRDGTEEVALRHGAKVFREPWKGFIGQKNSAAAKATQPWLLNLDADEVVTPSAVQKLVDKLRTQRHITIAHDTIPGANHFFANELDLLMKSVDGYLDYRLDPSCPIRPVSTTN